MTRKNRPVPPKGKPRFAIIVDGDCESWYFQMLMRNERSIGVNLKPEIPQRKSLKEQYERVIEQSNHYDNVFWIVDYDFITIETRAVKKGTESAAQAFKRYVLDLKKKHPNVTVIVNNPCLEYWILLHFEATTKYFDNCDGATKQLKKYLPDYEKTSKYYTKQGNDIYIRLKPHLAKAIKASKKLGEFDLENPNTAATQMHLLFGIDELKNLLD